MPLFILYSSSIHPIRLLFVLCLSTVYPVIHSLIIVLLLHWSSIGPVYSSSHFILHASSIRPLHPSSIRPLYSSSIDLLLTLYLSYIHPHFIRYSLIIHYASSIHLLFILYSSTIRPSIHPLFVL